MSPTDVALLAYTSGTTGSPKAAMISHRNLLAMAAGVSDVDPMHETDEIVSFLPFAWVGEQLMSVAMALYAGATVNFPEKPETMRAGPARDRAAADDRPAARLGGDVLGVSGEDRRCGRPQADSGAHWPWRLGIGWRNGS